MAGAGAVPRAAGPLGVRRQDRGRPRPARDGGLCRWTTGYGLAYIAALLLASTSFSRAGTSSDARRPDRCRRGAQRSRSWRRRWLQARRDAALSSDGERRASACSTPVRRGGEAHGARVRRARVPMSTGSGPSSTTAAIASLRERGHELPAALTAARSDDDARSVLHDRVSVRRDLSERSVPRRAGPAGPGRSRSCEKGLAVAAAQVAVLPRHRASCTTGICTTPVAAASWFQRAAEQPDAPNWLQPLAATMLSAKDRSAARVLSGSRSSSPISRGCAARAQRSLAQLQALDQIDELQALVLQGRSACRTAGDLDRPRARAASCRAFPSIRPASRIELDPDTGARRRSRRRPASTRCPICFGRRDEHRYLRARLSRAARPGRRQLPERLHPPPAVACVRRQPRLALPVVRLRAAAGPTTSRWSATSCSADVPLLPRADFAALSDRRAADHGVFVLHFAVFGADPLLVPRLMFACALIVLFAIDLEHHLLPNVITLPGIVVGLRVQLVFPPGPVARCSALLVGGGFAVADRRGVYRYAGQEGMGGGDVKMLAMIGAFLGWKLVARHAGFLVVRRGARRVWLVIVSRRGGHAVRAAVRDLPRSCRR